MHNIFFRSHNACGYRSYDLSAVVKLWLQELRWGCKSKMQLQEPIRSCRSQYVAAGANMLLEIP